MAGRFFCYAFATQSIGDMVFLKIGMSVDPLGRRETVACGCPIPLDYLVIVECRSAADMRRVEARLHERFAHVRSSREWFYFAADSARELIAIAMTDACGDEGFLGSPVFLDGSPPPDRRRTRMPRAQNAGEALRRAASKWSLPSQVIGRQSLEDVEVRAKRRGSRG